MSLVRGIKVTLEEIENSHAVSSTGADFIKPHKYTILSGSRGTLVETEEGNLFLVTPPVWFRFNSGGGRYLQVSAFNRLQDS
jgi:hypothetical protein